MPQKLNKAGKMQDYIPKGNGDASGEYGTSNGTNKNFTTSDKKSKANVITENKSVVVGDKKSNLPSKEELQRVKDKYGVSSDEDALRIIDKWDEWSKSKEGHDKLVKKLEDRIDNYEGVLENIKNGDETGKEKVEDYTRELRNAREEYKKLTGGKEYRSTLDKEKEMDNFRKTKANVIDNDLSGKTRDYDSITYPKGTSKEYTMKVDKEYNEALPILKEYGIDIKEFGSWEDKDAFADKFEEITNKYVFDKFKQEKDQSNKAWKDKGYQRLVDALEKVEDKQYNDWWIKNQK